MQTHLTLISKNIKTGPIPVSTTERSSCFPDCPFYDAGCYGDNFPLSLHWGKVTRHERGTDYLEFVESVKYFRPGTVWRHNQAGDIATTKNGNGEIDRPKLRALTKANKKKKGFTYCHHPRTNHNLSAIREAIAGGFIINLSTNFPHEAVRVFQAYKIPTVVTLPIDAPKVQTLYGTKIVRCPATNPGSDVQCIGCAPGMCQKSDRDFIVGFPAHGGKASQVDMIARQS